MLVMQGKPVVLVSMALRPLYPTESIQGKLQISSRELQT